MDIEIINNIKALAIDMIDTAKSGHPGICLGSAEILYTLYAKHINISIRDSKWVNRDRFILSAGHASALLYATLYMAGYDISIDDLKQFRQIESITPGHPEYGITPGVDCTTGPLGQGFATAVGMAMAEANLNARYKIIDHYTYVLCGDGDLMEGISYEAASIAGNNKLNKLIVGNDRANVGGRVMKMTNPTPFKSKRPKSRGGELANIMLNDGTAEIRAVFWTENIKLLDGINEGDLIQISYSSKKLIVRVLSTNEYTAKKDASSMYEVVSNE